MDPAVLQWGLSDVSLDYAVMQMLKPLDRSRRFVYMPAYLATQLCHGLHQEDRFRHWLTAALHGTLIMIVAWEGHWILLLLSSRGSALHLEVWDSKASDHSFPAYEIACKFRQALALQTCIVTRSGVLDQDFPYTCGTVCLLHLGLLLDHWTLDSLPDELDFHMTLLVRFGDRAGLRAGGKGATTGPMEERDILWKLRDLLHAHGVPHEFTEERAQLGLTRLGARPIAEALQSRNPWAALKALGSQPKTNYLWVKPSELEVQIRRRAQSKFKVHGSAKKSSGKLMVQGNMIDPTDLKLVTDLFEADDGTPVTQIALADVKNNRTGLAFAHMEDALPYLQGTESLSLGPLALLTTSPVPAESQGLLPVTNLRYPAIFEPTGEPILLNGSLIQLGDATIARIESTSMASMESTPTVVFRISLFRDEWDADWSLFVKSPVRHVVEHFPQFLLCRGRQCGSNCPRYHAPVEIELEAVICDAWARAWLGPKNKQVDPIDALVFQVNLRVPEVCRNSLHLLSGRDGLYLEPRGEDGRSTDEKFAVIWLPGKSKTDVVHLLKTTEKAITLTRLSNKWGLRTLSRDVTEVQNKVAPEDETKYVKVQSIYELRPFAHGTSRKAIQSLLDAVAWKAKPLQPGKADATGMCWRVGAEAEPPSVIIPTAQGDVTVTLQKQLLHDSPIDRVLSSHKTQALVKKQHRLRQHNKENCPPSDGARSSQDPWMNGKDPWTSWKGTSPLKEQDQPMQMVPKIDSLEGKLRDDLTSALETAHRTHQSATSSRLDQLEVDMQELKHQNTKFEGWFQDAAQANQAVQQQVGALSKQVVANDSKVSNLTNEIQSGFSRLEALMEKRSRTSE